MQETAAAALQSLECAADYLRSIRQQLNAGELYPDIGITAYTAYLEAFQRAHRAGCEPYQCNDTIARTLTTWKER